MYSLETALEECESDLDALGIEYGEVIDIHTNNRATRRWGQTRETANGYYVIEISKTLTDEHNPRESLKNVVMHELLHTCPDTYGHTGKWKQYANRVNRFYGYHVRTSDSASDLGIVKNCVPKKIKYRFQCQNCGAIISRQRECALTRNPSRFRCGKCGGRLKEIKE